MLAEIAHLDYDDSGQPNIFSPGANTSQACHTNSTARRSRLLNPDAEVSVEPTLQPNPQISAEINNDFD